MKDTGNIVLSILAIVKKMKKKNPAFVRIKF